VAVTPARGLGRCINIARTALFGSASERHPALGDLHGRLVRVQGHEVC